MSTIPASKSLTTPKKRGEDLVVTQRTITNASLLVGYGCFYGALIALLVAFLYPTMTTLNLQGYLTSSAISGLIGGHLTNTLGFTALLGVELFSALYGLIFGGIVAYIAGAAIPINVDNGTLDLALARPISRTRYYLEAWLGVLLSGIIMGLGILFFVWIASLFVKNSDLNWQWLWITQLVQFAFFFFAAGVGMLFGSFVNASRVAGGVAVGIIALGYVMNTFGSISDNFSWLLKITPFYYAQAINVLLGHSLTWWHPWVLVIAGLICGVVGLVVFNRRDLPTV